MAHIRARSVSRVGPLLNRGFGTKAAAPRHLLAISDLDAPEFGQLVKNGLMLKRALKSKCRSKHLELLSKVLTGETVAMMFNKLSTRTRVSTEAAAHMLGAHPMFLGKNDIQLGVNETLYDTSRIISSMTSCMVARVGPHSDVVDLAEASSVPVINALSADHHPLQAIADFITIVESLDTDSSSPSSSSALKVAGRKIAWVGDSNNVLFDLAIASMKTGIHIAVASPEGYGIPDAMKRLILSSGEGAEAPGKLTETTVPEEAIKDADFLVTDTWVSMGQEEEAQRRLAAFEGYQITEELAKRGGAKEDWKFMHCLPRHPEEVSDEVFYGPRSLVFQEGENRLYAALAALWSFVAREGRVQSLDNGKAYGFPEET